MSSVLVHTPKGHCSGQQQSTIQHQYHKPRKPHHSLPGTETSTCKQTDAGPLPILDHQILGQQSRFDRMISKMGPIWIQAMSGRHGIPSGVVQTVVPYQVLDSGSVAQCSRPDREARMVDVVVWFGLVRFARVPFILHYTKYPALNTVTVWLFSWVSV